VRQEAARPYELIDSRGNANFFPLNFPMDRDLSSIKSRMKNTTIQLLCRLCRDSIIGIKLLAILVA